MRRKIIILLSTFLIAILSSISYVLLTEKTIEGNVKIATGEKQLEEGQKALARGEGKLASGERTLSRAKTVYRDAKYLPFVGLASKLPIASQAFGVAASKISKGDRLVASGKEKVAAGKKQLYEGKIELQRGIEKLKWANNIRIASAVVSIFFSALFIILIVYWRTSIASFIKRKQ